MRWELLAKLRGEAGFPLCSRAGHPWGRLSPFLLSLCAPTGPEDSVSASACGWRIFRRKREGQIWPHNKDLIKCNMHRAFGTLLSASPSRVICVVLLALSAAFNLLIFSGTSHSVSQGSPSVSGHLSPISALSGCIHFSICDL